MSECIIINAAPNIECVIIYNIPLQLLYQPNSNQILYSIFFYACFFCANAFSVYMCVYDCFVSGIMLSNLVEQCMNVTTVCNVREIAQSSAVK